MKKRIWVPGLLGERRDLKRYQRWCKVVSNTENVYYGPLAPEHLWGKNPLKE